MMKTPLKAVCVLALFSSSLLALAQTGKGWEHTLLHHLPGMTSRQGDPMQVMNDQRTDLAECVAATEQVQQVVDQMSQIGSPWSRGRVNYSRHDLMAFAQREQALDSALNTLTTAHRELRNNLVGMQDRAIAKRLSKLDRLEANIYSRSAQLEQDLTAAQPGPGYPELSWDIYEIRKDLNNWHAEHKQIAREWVLRSVSTSLKRAPNKV